MTEIPIKKKGGFPWWIWLIAAALVVALLIWLFAGRDRTDGVQTADATASEAAYTINNDGSVADNETPITDLRTLLATPAPTVIGRQVQLTNVPAGAVPADAGFWVTGDGGKREYVILHEVETPGTPIEGRINVNEGDRLDIVGTVRAAADGVPRDAAIPGPTAPLPDGVEHYIDAQSVTKTR